MIYWLKAAGRWLAYILFLLVIVIGFKILAWTMQNIN